MLYTGRFILVESVYRKSKQMHQQKKRQEKSGSIVLLIALLYVYAQGAQ